MKSAYMSGPELYAVSAAGYEPIGIVIGVAAISMGSRGFGRSIRAIFNKGEMSAVSSTSTEARHLALQRMGEEGLRMNADLVLLHSWEVRDVAEIVEITCTGTAFRRVGPLTPMPMATATS
jgi:uncharacterized protein YbjQ (UPF0145 family)